MEKLGTNYGGWYIPKKVKLNKNSIIYSAGVGEDISFDVKLISKYDCNIYLIDPTQKALKHYNEYIKYSKNNTIKFTGNIQEDYYDNIRNEICNM